MANRSRDTRRQSQLRHHLKKHPIKPGVGKDMKSKKTSTKMTGYVQKLDITIYDIKLGWSPQAAPDVCRTQHHHDHQRTQLESGLQITVYVVRAFV